MKIECRNIKWDTGGEDPKSLGLPETVTYSINQLIFRGVIEEGDDDETVLTAVADVLTDNYGFCHDGFEACFVDNDNT